MRIFFVMMFVLFWAKTVDAGTIRSSSGAMANVASKHQPKFQCIVNWLDRSGYHIKFMTGIARRPYANSLHPIGAALDIDQSRRNGLFKGRRFPSGVNSAAVSCGLIHADRTVWKRHPDYGHFQVAGISRRHYARTTMYRISRFKTKDAHNTMW